MKDDLKPRLLLLYLPCIIKLPYQLDFIELHFFQLILKVELEIEIFISLPPPIKSKFQSLQHSFNTDSATGVFLSGASPRSMTSLSPKISEI